MIGSERQVAWAEKIRAELIGKVEMEIAKWETRECKTGELRDRADGMAVAFRKALNSYLNREKAEEAARRENAKWWIDNRESHFSVVHKWAMARFDKAFPKGDGEVNPNYAPRD